MKTRIVNGHEYRDRRSGLDNGDIMAMFRAVVEACANDDGPYVVVSDKALLFECPDCGRSNSVILKPAGEYELTGGVDAPTVRPAFRCTAWVHDHGEATFELVEGELVRA